MTPDQARIFASALNAAADIAEHEGRDLVAADIDCFVAADDAARADLAAVIAKAVEDHD